MHSLIPLFLGINFIIFLLIGMMVFIIFAFYKIIEYFRFKRVCCMVIIRDKDRVLLGYKKRGFGMEKYMGFAGKQKVGETRKETAVRELEEECGLKVNVSDLIYRGKIEYNGEADFILAVYLTKKYTGIPVETEEMKPSWYHISKIPYSQMWPDSMEWMPMALSSDDTITFRRKYVYDQESLKKEK